MFENLVNVTPVDGDLVFYDKVMNRFMFVIFGPSMAYEWECDSTFDVPLYLRDVGMEFEDFDDDVCISRRSEVPFSLVLTSSVPSKVGRDTCKTNLY